jgi:hypothetical protein
MIVQIVDIVDVATLRSIIRQAGFSVEAFKELI